MASRAIELFRQIVVDPAQAVLLRKMATNKTPESESLEFKGGRISETEAKKYWSQALSGFANTGGGVLIFGIKTDRVEPPEGGRKIDTAVDVDLVRNPSQFVQLLKDNHLGATTDPVQGVEYLAVPAEPDGSGFVVCVVPEGNNKPYRAELDPSKQYFQRVGDKLLIIPHALLRSRFYPRLMSKFEITAVVTSAEGPGIEYIEFTSSILNQGTATARDLLMNISWNQILNAFEHRGPFRNILGGNRKAQISGSLPLHPGCKFDLFWFRWKWPQISGTTAEAVRILNPPEFNIIVYTANQEPSEFSMAVQSNDILYRNNIRASMRSPC